MQPNVIAAAVLIAASVGLGILLGWLKQRRNRP